MTYFDGIVSHFGYFRTAKQKVRKCRNFFHQFIFIRYLMEVIVAGRDSKISYDVSRLHIAELYQFLFL